MVLRDVETALGETRGNTPALGSFGPITLQLQTSHDRSSSNGGAHKSHISKVTENYSEEQLHFYLLYVSNERMHDTDRHVVEPEVERPTRQSKLPLHHTPAGNQ
jgi:hypothetical protein